MAFEPRTQGEQYNTAKRLHDSISAATITGGNFRTWQEKVNAINMAMISQIEKHEDDYKEALSRYSEITEQEHVQNAKAEGVIPIEVYNEMVSAFKSMQDIIGWKFLQTDIFYLVNKKIGAALEAADAMEIKKQVFEQFKEMQTEMMNFATEAVNSRLKIFDERFIDSLHTIERENNSTNIEMVRLFNSTNENLNNAYSRIIKALVEDKKMDADSGQKILKERIKTPDYDDLLSGTPKDKIEEDPIIPGEPISENIEMDAEEDDDELEEIEESLEEVSEKPNTVNAKLAEIDAKLKKQKSKMPNYDKLEDQL